MESLTFKVSAEYKDERKSEVKPILSTNYPENIADIVTISKFIEEDVKPFKLEAASIDIKNRISKIDINGSKFDIIKKEIVKREEVEDKKLDTLKDNIVKILQDEIKLGTLVTSNEYLIGYKGESKSNICLAKNEWFKIINGEIKSDCKSLDITGPTQIVPNILEGANKEKYYEKLTDNGTCVPLDVQLFNEENCKVKDINLKYKCADCNFSSTSRRGLTEHLRVHKSPCLHCAHCSYVSKTKSTLKKHLCLIHGFDERKQKIFKCYICEQEYTLRYNLLRHMRIAHNKNCKSEEKLFNQENMFKCTYCLFIATRKDVLKKHINTHERKRFKCSQCEKSFSRKDVLNKHMLDHGNYQNLECRLCDRTYKTEKGLLQHLKKFGEKHRYQMFQGFKCTVCEKVYNKQLSLNAHKRTHLNNFERPFKCAHCGRGFALRSILKNHIFPRGLQHIFKCDYCEFSTFNRCLMRQHKEDHESCEFLTCHHCGFQCSNSKHLMIQHMKNNHG